VSVPPSALVRVRLGELAHADVGVPGRRLVHHPVRGWVAAPDRLHRLGRFGRLTGVPAWVALLLPLGVFFGLLVPRHLGGGATVVALAVSASVPAAAPSSAPAPSPSPTPVLAPIADPPTRASVETLPLPTVESAPPSPAATPPRKAPRSAAATASPRRAAVAASTPTAPVPPVFNETPAEPIGRGRDVLVAIKDGRTIVAPDARGLPAPFRVGELLPSGARLLRVDARAGEAETDRGVIRLE